MAKLPVLPLVLGLVGSPREGGNSDLLTDEILKTANARGARTEKIILSSLRVAACRACDTGSDDGRCLIEDDFQYIYAKVKEASVIVLSSPVYFGSVSAQTKTVIDRFQCHWQAFGRGGRKTAEKKRGVFICVSGLSRRDFFKNAAKVVKNFFATIGAQYYGELFCPGVEGRGDVLRHPEYMRKSQDLGKYLMR